MKTFRRICGLVLLFACLQLNLSARNLETYKGQISVPIVESDTVYARNNAFQSLQNLLLSAAIQDLIGTELYEEYQHEIFKNKTLDPANFLVSAKVLNEFSDNQQFTMELEGNIQLSSLADELRKMDLILKEDPSFPVSIVVDTNLKIPLNDLKSRFAIFHLSIGSFSFVETNEIPIEERSTLGFAERLFSENSRNKILFFIDSIPDESLNSIKGLRAQIFRKSDFALLSTVNLNLPSPTEIDSLELSTFQNFIKLFSLSNLEIGLYNEGLESTITLKVEGLIDPFNRHIFEDKILKLKRSIKSYQLIELSKQKAVYQLQSKISMDELIGFFEESNPHFYFVTEKGGPNTLIVESFYRYNNRFLQVEEWEPNQRILDLISETLNEENIKINNSSNNNLLFQDNAQEQLMPRFVEKEPNNNSLNLNEVPPETMILGYISSRADEDVFKLTRNVDSSTLIIEWIRIGKTSLSPQLRLYGSTFNFLNNYSLVGDQNKLVFQYEFKSAVPHRLFLRVSDKVGFIQGETGGFKSFHYLLKYYWKSNNQILKNKFSMHHR